MIEFAEPATRSPLFSSGALGGVPTQSWARLSVSTFPIVSLPKAKRPESAMGKDEKSDNLARPQE